MTDELKDRFQQLVADPPPPTAVPSEAVFARVRTVRRRRTAGVAALAAAAVVAITMVSSNLTEIDSSPPIANTPTVPTATIATSATTATSSKPVKPGPPPISAAVTLLPTVAGRTVTMKVTVSGTVLVPRAEGADLPKDTSFLNLSLGTTYGFGDGTQSSGSDGGGVTCTGAKTRRTGKETYAILEEPHTYPSAGTFTFVYTVRYCGLKGHFTVTKTLPVVIR